MAADQLAQPPAFPCHTLLNYGSTPALPCQAMVYFTQLQWAQLYWAQPELAQTLLTKVLNPRPAPYFTQL